MAKLSPRFVKYFIFVSLALAFIFPITHSAYEGFKDNENSDEEEEEEVEEGLDTMGPMGTSQKPQRLPKFLQKPTTAFKDLFNGNNKATSALDKATAAAATAAARK